MLRPMEKERASAAAPNPLLSGGGGGDIRDEVSGTMRPEGLPYVILTIFHLSLSLSFGALVL